MGGAGVIKWLGWMVGCVFTGDFYISKIERSPKSRSQELLCQLYRLHSPYPRMPADIKGIQPLNIA